MSAPKTPAELVKHFNELPRPSSLPSAGSGETVPNDWIFSVHIVSTASNSTEVEAAPPSVYLWLFNPPSQRAHLEHLPVSLPARYVNESSFDDSKVLSSEECVKALAPAVALCLLKAFVEDFGNRKEWTNSDALPSAPSKLYVERKQAKLGQMAHSILSKLGIKTLIGVGSEPIDFAPEAEERMSQAGWAQFRRKIEAAMQQAQST